MRSNNILIKMILIIFSIFILLPILLIIVSSLLSESDIAGLYYRHQRFGFQFTFHHYVSIFNTQAGILKAFSNSIIVTLALVTGNTFISIIAAYVLSKIRFKGSETFFYILVLIMILPVMVKLVPNYIILNKLKLLGSLWSIILPGIFNPFGIFILKQYMSYIPDEYINCARLDGATFSSSLYYIVIPMAKSGILSVIVFDFIDSWNMVEQPLVFLTDETKYPISLFLLSISQSKVGEGFAASVLYMLPVLLIFFFGKSHFIRGIQLTGLK